MAVGDDLMTLAEAAIALGVSERRAQQMAETGEIARYARGLVDRYSVERYLAANPGSRGRAWAEHTAWGAIALLTGTDTPWLGQTQRSRLRASLRDLAWSNDLADLLSRLRDRSRVKIYSGHRSAASLVRADIVAPDRNRLGLVDDDSVVDGYLATGDLDVVVSRYRLIEDTTGSITLRVTGFNIEIVQDLARHCSVLAAIDAATSVHPRERGVGEQVLSETLDRFR